MTTSSLILNALVWAEIAAVLARSSQYNRRASGVFATQMAPDFTLKDLQGKSYTLSELYTKKPVVMDFWATWCPVCRTEEGSINAISKDHQVLSVATTSGEAQEVAAYLKKQGLEFPVIPDESGILGVAWGIRGVPSSFIIDADGRIRHAAVGYTTEPGLRLRLWLAGF